MTSALLITVLALISINPSARAQTNIWPAQEKLFRSPAQSGQNEPPPTGWQKSLTASANLSLASSQDVVGQTSGTSQTYGFNIKGGIDHILSDREWRNEVVFREATSKTPNVPHFVKSDDDLKLSTIFLQKWRNRTNVGHYGRAEASAPLFKGEDVQSTVKTYRFIHKDQAANSDSLYSGSSVRLTDGFRPFTTKEAVGVFYRPIFEQKLQVETRLGAAAQQISANGQWAVKGANKAGEIEITELRNVNQAGLEAGVTVKGKVDEKTTYELAANSLTPFINDKRKDDRRDAWRLTNFEAIVKLTSKITDWSSFGYDYKVKIEPQLVDRSQQIHMIVLNLTYPSKPGKP